MEFRVQGGRRDDRADAAVLGNELAALSLQKRNAAPLALAVCIPPAPQPHRLCLSESVR